MNKSRHAADLDAAIALSEELRPVLHRLFRRLRRESQDYGISPLQILLLVTIIEHPGIGVTELARIERLRGPTISGHVNAMEAMGLVSRNQPHPEDRRRVGLVATKKGTEAIDSIRRRRTDWLAQKLAALTPEGREALRKAIVPLSELAL